MKRVNKGRKRGAITIFLSLLISAIILVECTYVVLVANLERGIDLRRAVDLQVNTYLAQYDRQLLKTYGIYAFDKNNIDDDVFRYVMDANGLSDGEMLYVSGMETFSTDDLRKVITMYYVYRGTGVFFTTFSDGIAKLIEQVDDMGIFKLFKRFTNSSAADIFMDILDGAIVVTDIVKDATEFIDWKNMFQKVARFNRLLTNFRDFMDSNLLSGSGFDTDDLGLGLDIYDFLNGAFSVSGDIIDDYLFHPVAVNYASYNFDCRLKDDTALDGTEFGEFHSRNRSDLEYILTGLEGSDAENLTATYIFAVLLLKNVVEVKGDDTLMAGISGAAEVLAIVVDVVSSGEVVLSSKVYEAVIVIIYAVVYASWDLEDLLDDDSVSFTVGDYIDIDLRYRDFVAVFMFLVPDDKLLSRMTKIINRDFDNYVVGISIVGDCDTCDEYEVTRKYMIYE